MTTAKKKTGCASKYNNRKTEIDGIKFDSQAEAKRYRELMLLFRAGQIGGLKLQPQFTLQEAFKTVTGESVRAITYKADFSYIEGGRLVVEDVKGVRTKEYAIKAKMMLDRFGIKVVEI